MVFITFLLKLSLAAARQRTVQDHRGGLIPATGRAASRDHQNSVRKTIGAITDIAPL